MVKESPYQRHVPPVCLEPEEHLLVTTRCPQHLPEEVIRVLLTLQGDHHLLLEAEVLRVRVYTHQLFVVQLQREQVVLNPHLLQQLGVFKEGLVPGLYVYDGVGVHIPVGFKEYHGYIVLQSTQAIPGCPGIACVCG